MPAKPSRKKLKEDRPLTTDEQRFIRSYVKVGAVEEKIELAERRARLKAGAGKRMLGRAHVLAEVHLRMEPVRTEQMRQKLLGDTVAEVTKQLEEKTAKAQAEAEKAASELSAIIACPEKLKCRPDLLEDALMRMAIGLDQILHPGVKLDAIRTALVVAGIMEQGTTRRVGLPDVEGTSGQAAGIYQGLFGRLREERGLTPGEPGQPPSTPETVTVEAAPAENRADPATIKARVRELTKQKSEPYDLMPRKKGAAADPDGAPGAPVPLPAPGESVDDLPRPETRNKAGRAAMAPGMVLTVEVG
jgi:hypothetical protein